MATAILYGIEPSHCDLLPGLHPFAVRAAGFDDRNRYAGSSSGPPPELPPIPAVLPRAWPAAAAA